MPAAQNIMLTGRHGIGKSQILTRYFEAQGMKVVTLFLGQMSDPGDLIGLPTKNSETGKTDFMPPYWFPTDGKPVVLFLDELNACSQEVQKAFYSLIHERRVGEYHLPEGSVVIGAGNRTQDGAIVKTMSSALINRMFHVQLVANAREWLNWAYENELHPWVIDYITQRPDHLFSEPPKTEEPYSTPRSWHMLSDALKEYHVGEDGQDVSIITLRVLAYGCLTPGHAGMFLAFTKNAGNKHLLNEIIKGDKNWPASPEDRDVLYFVAQSFRARLLHDLPREKQKLNQEAQYLTHRAKAMLKQLAQINYELAQMVVSADEGKTLPEWFMIEIVRDMPRLVTD
jgi:hypothetical protein